VGLRAGTPGAGLVRVQALSGLLVAIEAASPVRCVGRAHRARGPVAHEERTVSPQEAAD
jgi:hypothetical protein